MSTVIPYAIDANGDVLETPPPALEAIMHPNSRFSSVKFIKAISVLALVYPYVPLLVCHWEGNKAVPGGPVTADNIAGFIFLEGYECKLQDGHYAYVNMTNGETYTDNEVIRISLDVNPYALTDGYSPTLAAKKWSCVDDYLVDYQAGFFKNHAVPAGMFIIAAPTVDDFNDAVDEMEKKHKGAGKNNSVVYTMAHVDPITGQQGAQEIQWIPFNESNKDLALGEIFAQAERVRDMTFGVPAEVKGYLSNSNYSSVMSAERIYDKYVILPKLTLLWSDFTHELNRITGGLGFAFQFDYSVQSIAEDEKITAERKQLELDLLTNALDSGYKADKLIEALDLPPEFEDLAKTREKPQQPIIQLPQPQAQEEQPAEGSKSGADKALTEQEARVVNELERALLDALDEDVDRADDDTDEERANRRKALEAALLAIAVARMETAGAAEYARAVGMASAAGFQIGGAYTLTEATQAAYASQLGDIVDSYSNDTYMAIERAKAEAETLGLDPAQAVAALKKTEAWRATRVADSEEHRAFEIAQQDGVLQAQEQAHAEGLGEVNYTKTWRCMSGACDRCAELDGMTIPVEDNFPDDSEYGKGIAFMHPHCRCYIEYNLIDLFAGKSVKVDCPECGLFLTEGTHAHLEKMKCNRCKKWFSVDISNGRSATKEVK